MEIIGSLEEEFVVPVVVELDAGIPTDTEDSGAVEDEVNTPVELEVAYREARLKVENDVELVTLLNDLMVLVKRAEKLMIDSGEAEVALPGSEEIAI